MKLSEHRMATAGIVLMLVCVLIGVTCTGCFNPSSEATGGSVDLGDVDANVTVAPVTAVTAGNVDVSETVEAETTFADVAMRLLDDTIFSFVFQVMLIIGCIFTIYIMILGGIIIHGFYTGEIDPRKPRTKKG